MGKCDAFAGLRVLVERMPDVGRHLPPPDQIEARAPRACRQAMAVLRSLAVARVQGDLPHMLAWYHAAASAYGPAAAARLGLPPTATTTAPGELPDGGLTPHNAGSRPRVAQQVWRAFRDGVAWACALHAVAYCRRSGSTATRTDGANGGGGGGGVGGSRVDSAAAARVDLRRVYLDPRTVAELASNLALALAGMAEMRVPVMWAPAEVATYPGDDDVLLLLQVPPSSASSSDSRRGFGVSSE
jgi:hypothetical protein